MYNLFSIGNKWDDILKEEFASEYCQKIAAALDDEYKRFKIYPPRDMIFSALKTVDYSAVKVCILGQDPYHGAGQANGMAFAVCRGVPFPPSLTNIFKELRDDLSVPLPSDGTLTGWAKQGVLLLNASLTVREAQPLSHAGLGWNKLTDAVISSLSRRPQPLVFILWGASAISKTPLIASHHKIISSPHPSPLSASRGFFGSKPFSKANAFLSSCGIDAVDWLRVNDADNNVQNSFQGNVGSNLGDSIAVSAESKTPSPKPVEEISSEKTSAENKNINAANKNDVTPPQNNRRASYYNGTGSITKI